jgi:glycosyltransferase involved in cell wall biosynthesis
MVRPGTGYATRSLHEEIALATDAWSPQTNGVVRTLSVTVAELERQGHVVDVVHPGAFRTVPCPTYPEIRLAVLPYRGLARRFDRFSPEAVHIATEGPVGLAARRWCRRRNRPFTTSYHTQFPEYVRARAPIPLALTYAHLRRFHGAATRTLVATPSMLRQLEQRGFRNLALWSRGVDTSLFRPRPKGGQLELRGRYGSTSGGLRWKRESRIFSTSMCPVAS